uniref:ELM2 domain-containing protein n=1 Tax=Brugia malayi TaxID=6279 RepID=A8PU49_BRUMA
MKPNGNAKVKLDIGQEVKEGSEQLLRQDNDEVDVGDENIIDEENSDQAELQRTPRSSGDDEDMIVIEEDAPGPSDSNRSVLFYGADHAAFHLPTNLEIREGVDYQCPVQDWTTEDDYYDDTERETCVWRPTDPLGSC